MLVYGGYPILQRYLQVWGFLLVSQAKSECNEARSVRRTIPEAKRMGFMKKMLELSQERIP